MQWEDEAIILSKVNHGESGVIITLLTRTHGLKKTYARGGKKNHNILQRGNHVECIWRGRLREQLGNASLELIAAPYSKLLPHPNKLAALQSLCALLMHLPEYETQSALFKRSVLFLTTLHHNQKWQEHYIELELTLLSEMGFPLDLSQCAATGKTDNLCYVSPRSGCAVSQKAGEPYHQKLLSLPAFLVNREKNALNSNEIENGLALSGYFLNKYVFNMNEMLAPKEREHFLNTMRHTA